jgi:hypothetical protein
MNQDDRAHSPERVAILEWAARMGAVTAEAVAQRERCSVAAARSRLLAAERARLLSRTRPLAEQPALYVITPKGLRASGLSGLRACRITPANARHAIACAGVAAALELCYPDHRLVGERELRRDERESHRQLASARLRAPAGDLLVHRPDLVLWPTPGGQGLPVAVEVELTVKAPQRLLEICVAWARCRCVAGVLYLASTEVQRSLGRAIERAQAEERIVVVELDTVAQLAGSS